MQSPWIFEKSTPYYSGSSGDVAKMFKNAEVKTPGVFGADPPSPDAVLLAREVIQNSWDAARELRQKYPLDEDRHDFEIEFRFRTVNPEDRADFEEAAGLEQLTARVSDVHKNTDDGVRRLGISDRCIVAEPDQPLTLLEIAESGTAGMPGSWDNGRSKMMFALARVGETRKTAGAGGAFGYGKAGLIRGSRSRVVFAYSCFECDDEPRVSRRLMGMAYWGSHSSSEDEFTGFGRLGDPHGPSARPLVNDDADDLAGRLGLSERRVDDPFDQGTSFLLMDPGIEPADLKRAVEESWWPAMLDQTFSVRIVADGEDHSPRPKMNPDILPFIRAFEIATVPQDNAVSDERKPVIRKVRAGDDEVIPGALGLIADLDGWSFPPPPSGPDEPEHRSLVALMRSPRMVVEYLDISGMTPHVRGAFVASEEADDLLRQTEPPQHDAWDAQTSDDDAPLGATELAAAIHQRIRQHVNSWRRNLRPPAPDRKDLRLDVFEELMGSVFSNGAKRPKPAGDRAPSDVQINVQRQDLRPSPDGSGITVSGSIGFALADRIVHDSAAVSLHVRYKFLEDGNAGEECELVLSVPPGFAVDPEKPGRLLGRLQHDWVSVEFTSSNYNPDWSGRIVVEAELSEGLGANGE